MFTLEKSCKSCLIHFRQLNARIVRFDYLLGGPALLRESVSADLAHADAVSPAATEKSESSDAPAVVILVFDDKQLFTQTER